MRATLDLSQLIAVEDALDGMLRGETHEDYLLCFKTSKYPQAEEAWTTAQELVKEHGTVRKAANAVNREIEAQR